MQHTILGLIFFLKLTFIAAQPNILPHPALKGTLNLPEISRLSYRSGDVHDALNHAFDSVVALSPVKGFTAAVNLPDGTIWKRTHGISAENEPLTTGHQMEMGSISKTFVATTMLLLAEEGIVHLDDTIGKYLPAYPFISGQATIRQILSHTSGFFDFTNYSDEVTDAWLEHPDSIWQVDTMLVHFMKEPVFAPGDSFSYSNTNFLLAGRILEEVTGKHWYQVVREKILQPQGLVHTYASPWESHLASGPYAHPWGTFGGLLPLVDLLTLGVPFEGYHSIAGSAGSMISTPEDLSIFMKKLFEGQILQPASLAAMQTNYSMNPDLYFNYGLGAITYYSLSPLANWGHDGSLLHKSLAIHFPEKKFGIAVQQNDERISLLEDPTFIDLSNVFLTLLEAYLENEQSSATDNLVEKQQFKVWPNPATDAFQMQVNANIDHFNLMDVSGHILKTEKIENGIGTFNTESLNSGIYYVRAGSEIQKVVVLR